MSVLQLYLKHSIGQCLRDSSILFNKCLFRHTFWVRKDMGMTSHYETQGMISAVFIKFLQLIARVRYWVFGVRGAVLWVRSEELELGIRVCYS